MLQPGRSLLLLLILATGISVFLSIRLANRAAVASFNDLTGVLSQQSDAVLTAPAGPLPDTILPQIATALRGTGVEQIPILECIATEPVPQQSKEVSLHLASSFTLLGLDLVAVQNLAARNGSAANWFQPSTSASGSGDLWSLLAHPTAVFCTEELAREKGLRVGSRLPLVLNDRTVDFEIRGFIPQSPSHPTPPTRLLILDLPALQHIASKPNTLDRIEFLLPSQLQNPEQQGRIFSLIQSSVGETAKLRSSESQRSATALLTRGFRHNLTILSLLALLVGLYLIFQALDAAVVRRRSEIAILRALGVPPVAIRATWICESALLGLAGGILGVAGGWALAQGAVRIVSRTVNALYYASNASAAALHPGEAGFAILLAVGCSVAAGWLPARDAASTPPAQMLTRGNLHAEQHSRFAASRFGAGFALVAILLALAPPISLGTPPQTMALGGYGAALFCVVGGGFLAGGLLEWLGRILALVGQNRPSLQLASSHIRFPTSRHRWAVAGLLCAVAMTSGMAILVASFEGCVSRWIQNTLQADLYLTPAANQSATAYNRIAPETMRKITSRAEVAESDAALIVPVELAHGPVRVIGASLGFSQRHNQFTWLRRPVQSDVFHPDTNADLCLVSEAFANKHHARIGDPLALPTPEGIHSLRIAGVYTDYGDERGVVFVERAHLARWFRTEQTSTLSLLVRPGVDPENLRAVLRAEFPELSVMSNRHLRGEVMRIFRQTFAITNALEGIGIAVAMAGLAITLASILLERREELTTLRALGMRANSIALSTAWEGAAMALCGALSGIGCGLCLGGILIFVINKQTFGWTLRPAMPVPLLGALALAIVACGLLAAWVVGRWGARLPADRS